MWIFCRLSTMRCRQQNGSPFFRARVSASIAKARSSGCLWDSSSSVVGTDIAGPETVHLEHLVRPPPAVTVSDIVEPADGGSRSTCHRTYGGQRMLFHMGRRFFRTPLLQSISEQGARRIP